MTKKSIIQVVKLLVVLVLLGISLGFSWVRNNNRVVDSTIIKIDHTDGNYFVNDSLILSSFNSGFQPINKTTLGELYISNLEQWVEQNVFVQSAEVYRDVQGGLHASINQEIPIARVKTPKDEFYLTQEAKSIPLSSDFSAKVILVNGNVQPTEYQPLVDLIQQINADKLLKKHIVGIQKWDTKSFNLVVSQGAFNIHLGTLKNSKQKLEKLSIFYNQYLGNITLNHYSEIDLSFENQIVAKKNKTQ